MPIQVSDLIERYAGQEEPQEEQVRRLCEQLMAAIAHPVWRWADEWWGPGTLQGDLWRVRTERSPEALERLAGRLRWQPRAPQAQEALRRRTAEVGREQAHLLAFGPALLLALDRREEPQYIRFGRHWLVDDADGRVLIKPVELPMPEYWRWLRAQTVSFMEADLLDEAAPTVSASDLDLETLASEAPDPEELLLLSALAQEREALLAGLVARITPAEQRLLAAICDGAASLTEAACALGIKAATARVQWLSIRKKAHEMARSA